MQTSVLFHYVHTINCLPPADAGGSRRVFELVDEICISAEAPAPVYQEAVDAGEFLSALTSIEKNVNLKSIPLIHIDAHASETKGLEFWNNPSTPIYLSWDQVATALSEINVKTQNRLFVVFCACSAFYINGTLQPKSFAPLSLCVSPYHELTLKQIEQTVPEFYRALMIRYDIVDAARAVGGIFEFVSSEIFLKDVLVRMMRTTIGKEGRKRRENLLSDAKKLSTSPLNLKRARKLIKDKLILTDKQIDDLSLSYLCGRPVPFTAQEIMNEARNTSITRRDA